MWAALFTQKFEHPRPSGARNKSPKGDFSLATTEKALGELSSGFEKVGQIFCDCKV